ncbi:cyclic AMP receptor 2-like [Halichondria panicea]|uniref:cyclic AMP receptor 2-like n=1 Tax=Halichondria panicea TaxID=6063 RepID=UPI00312B9595
MSLTNGSINCSYYYDDDMNHAIVAAIRAAMGIFSGLCCLVVITVIVGFKKYVFFSQRLILYLAIAALFHSVSYSFARINYYTPRYLYDNYCYFGGFINLYSSWVEFMALCCLTFNVFINSVLDRWPSSRLQYIYLFVMYTLPLLWCWLPFLQHTYATTEGWCDLRVVDENCKSFPYGYILRFSVWYIPVYTILFICFIATIIAALTIHRRSRMWYGIYNPDQQQSERRLKNEVKPLIWYPIVYLLLTIFSLANTIDIAINPEQNNIVLWYLHVFTSPLRGSFIAIVYALDPETRKRISPRRIYSHCCLCRKEKEVQEYNVFVSSSGDSLRRVSVEENDYGSINHSP